MAEKPRVTAQEVIDKSGTNSREKGSLFCLSFRCYSAHFNRVLSCGNFVLRLSEIRIISRTKS